MNYEKHELLLDIKNISLKLGENQILKNLNIEIHNIVRPNMTQGQVVGLLGPSGIGKSKFVELISGLRKPDTGTIKIGTEQKDVIPGIVGVVQQNYPLFNHRTIMSNMLLASINIYKNKEEQLTACTNILKKLSMFEHIDKYPAQLSGGQRQRVAIAQQMVRRNEIYILDEPFSGLDINAIQSVSELIQTVTTENEKNTVIIISHDITNTLAISDMVWVMGRDIDTATNLHIPGSYIKYKFDLAEMGLAWQPNITEIKQFNELRTYIRQLFPTL